MNSKSIKIINLLKYLFWILSAITILSISILIFLLISQIFNINIGNLNELKININTINGTINDIQNLDKKSKLISLAYALIIASLLLKIFFTVLKLLNKFLVDITFSSVTSKLIFKTANLLLYTSITSLILGFILNLIIGKFEISIDFSSINFQLIVISGIVYIIGTLYENAVRLQSENDLTI